MTDRRADTESHFLQAGKLLVLRRNEIWKPDNQPLRVSARSLVCFWGVTELGVSGTSVGKLLRLGQPAVSRAVRRGDKIAQKMKLSSEQPFPF